MKGNNPYAQKTKRPIKTANPWTVAAGEHSYNCSEDKKKSSGPGRPKGGKGGGPGGNMLHARKVNPDKGGKNRRLGEYGIGSGENEDDGLEAGIMFWRCV